MPIVCYYAKEKDLYIIVDGFHRYRIMLDYPDIYEREGGMLPVSVINKSLDHRMASTIRHNRARGTHDVDLMSNIVKELHELGRSDAWISKHLGMDKDEILRLKQITRSSEISNSEKLGNRSGIRKTPRMILFFEKYCSKKSSRKFLLLFYQ